MAAPTPQIANLRRKPETFEKAAERAADKISALRIARAPSLESLDFNDDMMPAPKDGPVFDAVLEGRVENLPSDGEVMTGAFFEAIILADLRPPYFITGDQIVVAGHYDEIALLNTHKAALEAECLKVGRVDLFNHRLPYAGTGWLITDDIVVTNRHVAENFATASPTGRYDPRPDRFGQPIRVETNAYHQNQTDSPADYQALQVIEVLYMAGPSEPDFAFVRVANPAAIDPIDLAVARAEIDQPIAAVGYPASDPYRNDRHLMDDLFDNTYNVKRFSPGLCTGYNDTGTELYADYTTLGGNSGSVVIDIATQKAVGLHFAGVFEETNYAIPADLVWSALRKVRSTHISVTLPSSAPATESTHAESFNDRIGYDPEFLGTGELRVDYPGMDQTIRDDIAPVSDDRDGILKYLHFSVIQSASRRLPRLTAVNIDGAKSFALKRKGNWRLDGRLDATHQIGNELYFSNPLDRGHLVRRKDPGWGDNREEAQRAEIDTFHYTNAAPQHKYLNQRDWVGLEDYVLQAADTRDFKVSVFTGPVFQDSDRALKHQPGADDIPIPEHFWKIAIMVNADTGALSATGYLLTHGSLISNLTEAAFVLGAYKTYQVRIAKISEVTGLDFSQLQPHDPLNDASESLFGEAAFEITGPESIRL
ncbi:MAG: DNA/RNA non-specific endonuclease [Pseudomonadota bacterium]